MRIISIEGNIGAGKSSLLARLEKRYEGRVVCLFEPVGVWESVLDKEGVNMLQKYYADPKRWGFAFQVLAFTNRLAELKKACKKGSIIITERSLLSDRFVFAAMLRDTMDKCETEIYEAVADADAPSVDEILWLTVAPEECLRRIKMRSRGGEELIKLDYLEKLDEYHRTWLQELDVVKLADSDSADEEYWRRIDAQVFGH